MVILEETDPGTFDRGTPTRKLVHQLSSTCDPVFNLTVPASRIIGGYTVKDGVIIPRYSHGEIIEAVFRRTRVGVGLMTSAKLLSAIEPVIRYGRGRFRGSSAGGQGTPRYDLGLQMKEDVLHRLVDVWACGEAGASLGFATARLFDRLDPIEREKNRILEERGIKGSALIKLRRQTTKDAIEFLKGTRPELAGDAIVETALLDSIANGGLPKNPTIPWSYTVWKWLFKPVLGTFALFGFLGVLAHYVTSGPRLTQPEPPEKDGING